MAAGIGIEDVVGAERRLVLPSGPNGLKPIEALTIV